MDPEALRAFLAIVESGSFVAAATALRSSRASVRRRIDELEASIGVPLLVRSEQGATPTRAGELLAERGRILLNETSSLVSSVRELGATPDGTLRVALPVGLPPKLMSLCFSTVRATQPGLRLHVRFAEDPIALLLHDIDVAVSFGDAPAEGPWVTRVIVRIPERFMASPAYLSARGTPTRVEDLASHDLLVWEAPERRAGTVPLRAGGAFPVTPVVVSSDLHVLRTLASDGLGLVYGADGGLPAEFAAGPELVPVLDDVVGRERTLRIVMPTGHSQVPRILSAIELLQGISRPAPAPVPEAGRLVE
ncbi:MAG: LysR family transcriptional regulator [Polyangiaceae bacterium]